MSFPKYFVTYCVMDSDTGANPMGHAALIFSKQDSMESPVQVIDCIGYYSQPSTSTNPIVRGLKKMIHIDVDLQGGHGVLKHEQMHYMDNNGLRGISFALDEHKFYTMRANYLQLIKSQEETIQELNAELISKNIVPNGHNRYLAEKAKALTEGRPPRLKPFNIELKLTMKGFDTSSSFTCKDFALELLMAHQVISTEVRDKIICARARATIPIFSSLYLPPIRLISTGDPGEVVTSKRTQEKFYNRTWSKNALFWATPTYTVDENISCESKNYYEFKNLLNIIRESDMALRQKIDELQSLPNPDLERVKSLSTHLQRIKNLALMFNNNSENTISEIFQQRAALAAMVIAEAENDMSGQFNYAFLFDAYCGISLYNALLALILLATSILLIIFVSPAALSLTAVVAIYTGYQFFENTPKPSLVIDKDMQQRLFKELERSEDPSPFDALESTDLGLAT